MGEFESELQVRMELPRLKNDIECESDEEAISVVSDDEYQREQIVQNNEYKVASNLGILDKSGSSIPRIEVKSEQAHDIAQLTSAFTKIARARSVQAKAYMDIAAVLARTPSLSMLAQALDPVAIDSSFMPPASHLAMPPTKKGTPQILAQIREDNPKRARDGVNWVCFYCDQQFTTWDSADSHTRKAHTGVKYGPCPTCLKWSSFNSGSFRGHKIQCKSMAKRRVKTEYLGPSEK